MPTRTEIIICGALGGISTNLFGVAAKLLSGPTELPSHTRLIGYGVGLVVLASLGGLAAYISDEKVKKKAFYIGIGLPAFLRLALADVSATRTATQDNPPQISRAFSWVSIAYAETPRPALRTRAGAPISSTRTLDLSLAPAQQVKVVFSSADRTKSESLIMEGPASQKPIRMAVPPYAASFVVMKANSASAPVSLDSSQTAFTIEIQEKSLSGFYNALGVKNTQNYSVKVFPSAP